MRVKFDCLAALIKMELGVLRQRNPSAFYFIDSLSLTLFPFLHMHTYTENKNHKQFTRFFFVPQSQEKKKKE